MRLRMASILSPGSPPALPSTRSLISLIALEVEGWVEVRTGSGVYVLDRPGKLNGADVTVKDTKRYKDTGGWGYRSTFSCPQPGTTTNWTACLTGIPPSGPVGVPLEPLSVALGAALGFHEPDVHEPADGAARQAQDSFDVPHAV